MAKIVKVEIFPSLESENKAEYRRRARMTRAAAEHCDEIAKTPFHKHIPVRISPLAIADAESAV